MKFTDLTPGVVIRTPPRVVTSKEIVEFASRYDPQWFHIDPARARDGRWKGLIASGWHPQHDRQVMTLQGTTPVRGAGPAVAGVGGHANRATAAHGEDVRAAGRCARGQNRMRATEQPAP